MDTKIEIVSDWTLLRVIDELENGSIKIPMFQRDYEWEKSKIVLLLNSIYLQYPIGTFFLWIAPPEYNRFIRTIEGLPKTDHTSNNNNSQFILDGQQRLLSLFRTFKASVIDGIDYSQICFNPAKKTFKIPRTKSEKYNIPAYKLFDKELFEQETQILRNDSERIAETWRQARNLLINYPLSVVKTLNYDIDDVVEIFERINQGGKRLSSFDLIHATTWSTDFDLKIKMKEFNSVQKVVRLGALSDKVFTYSLSMNAFDDCRSSSQLKLNPQIAKNIWNKTRLSLSKSIDFLTEMSISTDLSSYQTHLIVLQYYFFKTGATKIPDKNLKDVEKWFWDARFTRRYSTLIHTKIKDDAVWLVNLLKDVG